jgi:DNA-binding transcriptional regulator GbsR (MarR family)
MSDLQIGHEALVTAQQIADYTGKSVTRINQVAQELGIIPIVPATRVQGGREAAQFSVEQFTKIIDFFSEKLVSPVMEKPPVAGEVVQRVLGVMTEDESPESARQAIELSRLVQEMLSRKLELSELRKEQLGSLVNDLMLKLDQHQLYATVLKVNNGFNKGWTLTQCATIGKELTAYCNVHGLSFRQVQTQDRFGKVGCYPAKAWLDNYGIDITIL